MTPSPSPRPPGAPPSPGARPAATQLNSLTPSLVQDLQRQSLGAGQRRGLLEVLAACLRHGQPAAVQLRTERTVLQLGVWPHQRLLHCAWPLDDWLAVPPSRWQVDEVRGPGNDGPPQGMGPHNASLPWLPLAPLLWTVALAGSRSLLLPELAGQAAYRLAPGANLQGLGLPAPQAQAVARLGRGSHSLDELGRWPGMDDESARRLLNALYLQSALITSRTHPAATNEGWQGYQD